MLFVHDALVLTNLKTQDTERKKCHVVEQFGSKHVAVRKFMHSGKGKALHLKGQEHVERNNQGPLVECQGRQVLVTRQLQAGLRQEIDGSRQDGKVGSKAQDTGLIGLFAKLVDLVLVHNALYFLHTLGSILIPVATGGLGRLVYHMDKGFGK